MSTPISNDVGELVDRLKAPTAFNNRGEWYEPYMIPPSALQLEAATVLSSQAAEIAELRMALEGIASKDTTGYGRPALGRIAREALAQHAFRRAVALTRKEG